MSACFVCDFAKKNKIKKNKRAEKKRKNERRREREREKKDFKGTQAPSTLRE